MMLLHLREEVEAEEGSNAAASSLANAISSAENVVKALEAIQHAGDQNLGMSRALLSKQLSLIPLEMVIQR